MSARSVPKCIKSLVCPMCRKPQGFLHTCDLVVVVVVVVVVMGEVVMVGVILGLESSNLQGVEQVKYEMLETSHNLPPGGGSSR